LDTKKKSKKIKELAALCGFDAYGIAPPTSFDKETKFLIQYLKKGYNAEMTFLERNIKERQNPFLHLNNAKSIIVVLKRYYQDNYPFENRKYKISRYAIGKDYHIVIKNQLANLLEKINEEIQKIEGKIFVDSSHIFEKPLALRAGLGWIGKNSLLVNEKYGSFCFIGGIITNLELEFDNIVENKCGSCNKCIDACPTKAIVQPYVIDARKCISYNTIENKNLINKDIINNLNGWIFGCDICQNVCPWNKNISPTEEPLFKISGKLLSLSDNKLETLCEKEFDEFFAESSIKRAKYSGLKRNIEVVRNNLK